MVAVPVSVAESVYSSLGGARNRQFDITKLRSDLGYTDIVPVDDAIRQSITWLANNPLVLGGEIEQQLGDPFDYETEDRIAEIYRSADEEARKLAIRRDPPPHMFRNPKTPGARWSPKETATS